MTTKFLHFRIKHKLQLIINNIGCPADLDYIASPLAILTTDH